MDIGLEDTLKKEGTNYHTMVYRLCCITAVFERCSSKMVLFYGNWAWGEDRREDAVIFKSSQNC